MMHPRQPSHAFGLAAMLSCVAVQASGCGSCGTEGSEKRTAEPAESPSTGGGGEKQAGTESAPGGPPPTVRLRGAPDAGGRAALVVQSRGDAPARLARAVTVQREADGGWHDTANLSLRWSCDHEPDGECIALVPGAELRPPVWLGKTGEAQCECDDCEPAPAGRYRFLIRSCGGAHELASAPFRLTR